MGEMSRRPKGVRLAVTSKGHGVFKGACGMGGNRGRGSAGMDAPITGTESSSVLNYSRQLGEACRQAWNDANGAKDTDVLYS